MLFRKFSYERAIAVAIVIALVLLLFVYQKLELSKQMTGLDRTPSEFCKVMRDAFAFGDLDQQMINLLSETTPHYPTKEEVIQKLYFGQSPYDGFETIELPPQIYQPAAETVEAAPHRRSRS